MIPGAKNAAGWWSAFVYSFSVDPFHDVPEIHEYKHVQTGLGFMVCCIYVPVSIFKDIYF